MPKNIILCSDGTGNTFKQRSSNVSELIKSLDLAANPPCGRKQFAFYDQGVGTNPGLVQDALAYAGSTPDAANLKVLHVPQRTWWNPAPVAWVRGMAKGYGLRENVQELVRALAENHAPDDDVYLFGFSRGAFTVRAVAGFVHRCGLPRPGTVFDDWFEKGFRLYEQHFPPPEDINAFQTAHSRLIRIHFLGIWDTVKSYGGLKPISWPHLRHNPSVDNVRHALALDEQRAWFQCTTWGRTDEVIHGKQLEDPERYTTQDVEEVWFRGFHSDIGGGTKERKSARVALLWMLGEAAHFGLRLNKDGVARFDRKEDFNRKIKPHDSRTWWWPLVGVVTREELRNDWRPPQRDRVTGSKSPRNPLLPELKEGQDRREVLVHVSALDAVRLPHVRVIETRPLPTQRALVDPLQT